MKAGAKVTDGLLLGVNSSLALLVLSYLRIAGDLDSAAFADGGLIKSAFDQPLLTTALGAHVTRFGATIALIHILLGIIAWSMAQASLRAWRAVRASSRAWTLTWILSFSAWILFANAAFFPGSSLGSPYAEAVAALGGERTAFFAGSVLVAMALWTLAKAGLSYRPAKRYLRTTLGASAAFIATAMVVFVLNITHGTPLPSHPNGAPHVVLIGLDSLRPDIVGSREGHARLPRITAFLDTSTVFSDTLTPLARTFPSWVSIISGKHPHSTGAIANLWPRGLIHEGDTLPRLLRGAGYRTVFATDEARFSNLDESFGFESVIAPPMGAADFLLGFFGDTPLANLLSNQAIGRALFPYAHANRGAAVTYDPDTFVKRLDALPPFAEPTLLAIHLTLVHWPYTWATMSNAANNDEPKDMVKRYWSAAARLDQQFGDVLTVLANKGALSNAIVVLLSDHGESLGETPAAFANDRWKRGVSGVDVSSGHGTNIFAEQQYRVLLAFRTFGDTPIQTRARTVDGPASLEDIAPTIIDALHLQSSQAFDGFSLLSTIATPALHTLPETRVRYMETGFNPPDFDFEQVSESGALRTAATFYRVDPETDRVLLRPEFLDEILETRQYAAVRGGHMVAAIPAQSASTIHVVRIAPGEPPVWMASEADAAAAGEASELWQALRERFALGSRRIAPPPLDNQPGSILPTQ